MQLAENGELKVVAGTRDWGSDFAVLHSGCGAGVEVIASSSGEAASDSLRAYELPALEAVPASAPLIDGRNGDGALNRARRQKRSRRSAECGKTNTRWTVLRRFAISFFLVLFLVLVGVRAWGRTRPHYGGSLRVEISGDPWHGPDGLARRLVLDGLTALDANGLVSPALAVDWQSDDNDHRWQFRLRQGVHFHDGSPLNAEAVAMALNTACTANCPWTAVRAVGSMVVFTGDSPMPNLPALLASNTYLIMLTRTADGQTPANPIGTGPFQFTSSNNGTLTLTANDSCWQGRPFLDEIVIVGNRQIRDQWLDLSVGRADIAEIPPQELRQAQQQRLSVVVSPPVELLALAVSDSGPLGNAVLRAAIAASHRSRRALECHLSKAGRDHRQPSAAIAHRLRISLSGGSRPE